MFHQERIYGADVEKNTLTELNNRYKNIEAANEKLNRNLLNIREENLESFDDIRNKLNLIGKRKFKLKPIERTTPYDTDCSKTVRKRGRLPYRYMWPVHKYNAYASHSTVCPLGGVPTGFDKNYVFCIKVIYE